MTGTSKLASLQSALDKTRAAPAPVRQVDASKPAPRPAPTRQANRQDKVNIAAWLHPDFKRSLRLVQARNGANIQQLLEEALNDLFAKYDVPQVVLSNASTPRH